LLEHWVSELLIQDIVLVWLKLMLHIVQNHLLRLQLMHLLDRAIKRLVLESVVLQTLQVTEALVHLGRVGYSWGHPSMLGCFRLVNVRKELRKYLGNIVLGVGILVLFFQNDQLVERKVEHPH
jgi:hypothetical protein